MLRNLPCKVMSDGTSPRHGPSPERLSEPDAAGQAALLLVEAMLHELIEIGAFTLPRAISVVEAASEVAEDIEQADGLGDAQHKTLGLLKQIELSLKTATLSGG